MPKRTPLTTPDWQAAVRRRKLKQRSKRHWQTGIFGAVIAGGAAIAFNQSYVRDFIVDEVAELYSSWVSP